MGVWLQQITLPESENPHTEVVDCSKSSLQQITVPESENPTHGSVWIVQIQPTRTTLSEIERIPHTEVCGMFRSRLPNKCCQTHSKATSTSSSPSMYTNRLDLKHPPKAPWVGFLSFHKMSCKRMGLCVHYSLLSGRRLDLNNPHTSVCGILGFGKSYLL